MSAQVKILVEGFTNADLKAESGGEERTRPTISLVRDGDLVMVVDPGVLDSQQILIDALSAEGLRVGDVNVVCITHSHIDHYRNIGMFFGAKTLEYFGLWDKETVDDWQEQFSENIQIVRTPGHDYTGITLFVKTEDGVVAICGDVFWKENYPADLRDDVYASNPEELKNSRELVLKMADWVIPGHAGIYKVKKESIAQPDKSKEGRRTREFPMCKKCHRLMNPEDKCLCRPWLCFRCCECGLDCDLCSCSHKK